MTLVVRNGDELSNLTTDELFERIAAESLVVNNLFELSNGKWRCSLRSKDDKVFFEFGESDTARKAIFVALHNAHYILNTSHQTAMRHVIR